MLFTEQIFLHVSCIVQTIRLRYDTSQKSTLSKNLINRRKRATSINLKFQRATKFILLCPINGYLLRERYKTPYHRCLVILQTLYSDLVREMYLIRVLWMSRLKHRVINQWRMSRASAKAGKGEGGGNGCGDRYALVSTVSSALWVVCSCQPG